MKLTTYAGLSLIAIVLILQRFDYAGWGLLILGIALCIPEIVEKVKNKK